MICNGQVCSWLLWIKDKSQEQTWPLQINTTQHALNWHKTYILLTAIIYPCHSAGGTVRAFTGVGPPRFIFTQLVSPALPPSAESHYTISAPYGLLTRYFNCRRIPQFVVSSLRRVLARWWSGYDLPPTPGISGNRFSLFRWFHTTVITRCSGPPGVNLGYFQRTIVRYTEFTMMDRGLFLCCGLVPDPPASSACPLPFGTGHTCTSTHAFASGLLQAYIAVAPSWDGEALAKTLAFGYPSPPSGWVWTLLGTCVTIPGITN